MANVKTRTYKSDEDYITKHIKYRNFGEDQIYGTFCTGDGYGFSAQMYKCGRITKSIIASNIVGMVLQSGRPVRGYYNE